MNLKEKKRGKILTRIIIGGVVGAAAISILLIVFGYYFLYGGPAQITNDAKLYEETMHKYRSEVVGKVRTGFVSFPESIPESAFINGSEPEFYFSYRDTWDDPTCEVLLKCKYSDADYSSELDRLKDGIELKGDDRKIETSLEYEESKRFSYPVYKAIDCDDYAYEYAMDLGNNEIAYIYTSFKEDFKSLKKIPEEYLPTDFESCRSNYLSGKDGYSVYLVEKTSDNASYEYGDRFD